MSIESVWNLNVFSDITGIFLSLAKEQRKLQSTILPVSTEKRASPLLLKNVNEQQTLQNPSGKKVANITTKVSAKSVKPAKSNISVLSRLVEMLSECTDFFLAIDDFSMCIVHRVLNGSREKRNYSRSMNDGKECAKIEPFNGLLLMI